MTSGCISERRADWADWREGSEISSKCCVHISSYAFPAWGRNEGSYRHTLVVCSTLASRGKSLTPWSRVRMDEERVPIVSLSEETQPWRECAMVAWLSLTRIAVVVDVQSPVYANSTLTRPAESLSSFRLPTTTTTNSPTTTPTTNILHTQSHYTHSNRKHELLWTQMACASRWACNVRNGWLNVELTFSTAQPMWPFYTAGMLEPFFHLITG